MIPVLLETLAKTSLSAAVMVLAAVVLRVKFQERTPRRVFCLLWDIILLRLLVPIEISSPVSVQRFWQTGLRQAEVSAAVPKVQLVEGLTEGTEVLREAYFVPFVVEETAGKAPAAAFPWGDVLGGVWLAGAALLGAWLLVGHLLCRRDYAAAAPVRDGFVLDWLARHPLRRPVQVKTCGRVASPLTYGVIYPVVLLPDSLVEEDRASLDWVLAHEWTHIKRFDTLRKGLLAAALCLHWFNPLVWAMYALANRDIELACDEAVLRGNGDREGYALALLGLEERRGWRTFTGFSQNALEERIRAIMKHKHTSVTALLAVLIVMSLATTVFASAAPEDKAVTAAAKDEIISMLNGETGEKQYSDDGGETWMTEESYQARYGSWGDDWDVQWWSYDEYKAWLEQEKADLQDIIGSRGWTPSTGWFTWDQKRVDETIAMYEEILEKIGQGALYSKAIFDKNGQEIQDVTLGSDGPIVGVAEAVTGDDIVEYNINFDAGKLLEELKQFGVSGKENELYYNGQLVRYFVDGAAVGDDGYSVQYVSANEQGTVDVHTLRAVIHNPDGSYDTMGELIGVAARGDANFDQELVDCATFRGVPPATTAEPDGIIPQDMPGVVEDSVAEDSSNARGKTFEEIFAAYSDFGLKYQPQAEDEQRLTCNGQAVRSFTDLKPDGGVFSYENPYAGDGARVYTVYGKDSVLAGLDVV